MLQEKLLGNIPADIAKKMVDAYARESNKNPSYTKAVWFPAEQIIELAKTLEDGKHDGLRIYFGQYASDSITDVPESYEGRNTVLLVPTLSPKGFAGTEHEDDLGDIGNKGVLCPSQCEGTAL